MKTLLLIDSSGRVTRSLTRRLTDRFATRWRELQPAGEIVRRDLGRTPPPPVDEAWIAAAFAHDAGCTAAAREALALSDTLIDEIGRADAIVLGVPMYNFGVPAQLKAYIDQVVRVGRTFAFDASAPEPYQPLLPSKPVVVITSAGDGAIHPGGTLAHLNFLEPHLQTVFRFIGLTDLTFVRVGYDEYQDHRLQHSLAAADRAIDELAERFTCSELRPVTTAVAS
ncbi:MAG TPA: NAD(P)H-dependent oxidoreductase [Opitutaceae bacterium]